MSIRKLLTTLVMVGVALFVINSIPQLKALTRQA